MTLKIDFSNMIGESTGGIPESEWAKAADLFSSAHSGFQRLRESGAVGFVDIASDNTLRDQSLDFATLVKGRFDDVVVLGIGGSALGPIALRTALRPSAWNMLSDKARDGFPRLQVLDNVDPETIAALLGRTNLARTLFVVTSKSGGTAETMSQFMIIDDSLTAAGLPAADHLVFITDPAQGALRPLAKARGISALDIPPNIGGRYSVLTPVGTLPAALIGIDITELLAGAAEMGDRCATPDLAKNPAGIYALLLWLADTRYGKAINVLMPYSDPLRDFADWFVQLWAESLGKHTADGGSVGSTPLAALGATDQHSQVQLFSIEQRATAGALATRGRPNLTIHIDRVDARHVGGLMMLLEIATAFAGQLYGVDAFNQPGVELGKQFAYALLGRPGTEAAKKEWDSLPQPDARWNV